MGGDLPRKMPRKKSKMDGVVCVSPIPHKGECWEVGYKYSKTHLPASAVPQNVKKGGAAGRSHQTLNRESGWDIAVSDLDQSERPQKLSSRSSHQPQ